MNVSIDALNVARLTKFAASCAVDVEGEVALSFSGTSIGKHKTIRTEFLRQDKVFALIIPIALD